MCISDYSRRVSGYSWVADEDGLWLSMVDRNGICKIDRASGNTTMVLQFPNHEITERNLYSYLLYKDKKVICTPHLAREVAVYDLEKEHLDMIPLKYPDSIFEGEYSESNKFIDGLLYGNSVYMFGYSYPAIVKMDIDTMELTYLADWMGYYPYTKKNSEFLAEGHAQIGSDVYLAMKNTNMLVRLDLKTDMTEVFPIECGVKKIMYVAAYQDNIFLLSWDECSIDVVSWNPSTGGIKEYCVETSKNKKISAVYWMPIVVDNWIYLFPLFGDEIYTINLSTGEYSENKEIKKIVAEAKKVSLLQYYTILSARNVSGRIVFQTGSDCCFHEFDPTTGEINSYSYLIADDSYMKRYCTAQMKSNFIKEEEVSLPFFLSGLHWYQ